MLSVELLIGAHNTRAALASQEALPVTATTGHVWHNVAMSYRCTAIFAKGDQSILDAACLKWKGCLARSIDKPFKGVGFADPGADCCYPLVFNTEQHNEHEKIVASMKSELASWSEKFPSTVFVLIEADCFGGVCDFEGFVVHNGIQLCKHDGKDALKKLAAYLDVEFESDDRQLFEPFTRGFFHICRDEKKR